MRQASWFGVVRLRRELTAEALDVRKNLFSRNQQLQVFDFIEAKFAILMVFEFFLMTAEGAE